MLRDERRVHAERGGLRGVCVGDVAGEENFRRAGDIRELVRDEAAGAALGGCDRFSERGQFFHDDLGKFALVAREDPFSQPFAHEGRRTVEHGRGTNEPHVHLAGPRAIADFEAHRDERFADGFLDDRLADAEHAERSHFVLRTVREQRGEDWHELLAHHRHQLARRAGQQENVRRSPFFDRGKVQAGRGAVRIPEHGGLARAQSLELHAVIRLQSATREAFLNRAPDFLVVLQLQAEQFRDDVARDVVRRGAEAAGHEHDVGVSKRVAHGVADRPAVGHRDLPLHAQPEREKLARDECEVRVHGAAEHEFGAGIDDLDAHGCAGIKAHSLRKVPSIKFRSSRAAGYFGTGAAARSSSRSF